ncbi:DNA mismatch repair protein Mlh1 [Polyrhizophydium stewartii]|uniref:DNA mismatch repair protein Mlh1 n=1 Tax=Polyrhizophydium stewartii TaxID=2732419 RepID=A0ABR4MXD0_9FUNG
MAARIHRLDEATVNRIAAGEIIHRPANALKELLENALDAGSTSVQVLVKDGGLKLLQIQDTGHGIHKDDLGIVCERFTTSKLRKFEDLHSIATFGFRGEALASISHVAHLTITSRTPDSPCAWRATYSDGKLVPPKAGASADPKPCAGNAGTTITVRVPACSAVQRAAAYAGALEQVEDLFFNVPIRRKTFTNLAEEYTRVLEVVQRYAIHNSRVGFSCKKHSAQVADLQTASNASKLDNIRAVFGNNVARELIEFEFESVRWQFKATGHISNANFNTKRFTLLLFINNRLVESPAVKKSLEALYAKYLPKGTHPFVYLSLELNPETVDVNVHPTKRHVQFLHEDSIIEALCEAIDQRLASANDSRVYYVQTTLSAGVPSFAPNPPASQVPAAAYDEAKGPENARDAGARQQTLRLAPADSNDAAVAPSGPIARSGSSRGLSAATPVRAPEHKLVRTDNRVRTLDAYIAPAAKTVGTSRASPPQREAEPPTINPAAAVVALADTETANTISSPSKRQRIERAAEMQQDRSRVSLGRPASLAQSTARQPAALPIEDDIDDFDDDAPRRGKAVEQQREPDAARGGAMDVDGDNDAQVGVGQPTLGSLSSSQTIPGRHFVDVRLTSVLELRDDVVAQEHKALTEMFREHSFVGCVNNAVALIQHHTKLYLVNYQDLSRELCYQVVLRGFSNFGFITLETPLSIHELVLIALDCSDYWEESMMPKQEIAATITTTITDRREMLLEYFSIQVDGDGLLGALPVLMRDYVPNMDKLPEFVLRLGSHVNWDEERPCFQSIAEELAVFYEVEAPLADELAASQAATSQPPVQASLASLAPRAVDPDTAEYRRVIEHVVFPHIKRYMIGTKAMLADKLVTQIADLPDLYKVFERC